MKPNKFLVTVAAVGLACGLALPHIVPDAEAQGRVRWKMQSCDTQKSAAR